MSELTPEPGRGPVDPNYILSQEEFHQGLADLHQATFGAVDAAKAHTTKEVAGLRTSIGWCLIVIAIWFGWVGFLMATQQIRGSR